MKAFIGREVETGDAEPVRILVINYHQPSRLSPDVVAGYQVICERDYRFFTEDLRVRGEKNLLPLRDE